jgi:hypothetical protein
LLNLLNLNMTITPDSRGSADRLLLAQWLRLLTEPSRQPVRDVKLGWPDDKTGKVLAGKLGAASLYLLLCDSIVTYCLAGNTTSGLWFRSDAP